MDRIRIFISYLIFALVINQIQAQNNDGVMHFNVGYHDTISTGECSLVIDVPIISLKHKSINQYEEGFFITYPYLDSAYLFIHKGYNIKRPFCDTTQIKLISEDEVLKCYYGVINDLYSKEVYYKKSKITISYVNVRERDLLLFDKIIASLTFIPCSSENKNKE